MSFPYRIIEGADTLDGKEALTVQWLDGRETVEVVSQGIADFLKESEDEFRAAPSLDAMKAAVELEITSAIGRVTTSGVGRLIDKVANARVREALAGAERKND
jgi:5,10-methylenetetrahydrofolate reductase